MTITFDSIKKVNEFHSEYWNARELQELLGYTKWSNFINVIEKAKISCKESGNIIDEHFTEVGKPLIGGNGATQIILDFYLSRYACYLIAQNGNPTKKQIALAQSYFASQTRKQEVFEELQKDYTRLDTREEISEQNKRNLMRYTGKYSSMRTY